MDAFSRADLRELLEAAAGPCVSLYMPTHRGGAEVQQAPIRLKNLLRRAEELLAADGRKAGEIREFLGEAHRLVGDTPFWRHQADGLAVFAAPGRFHRWRLPLRFEELAVCGERFHVKPLLGLLSGDGRYYVLCLSQGQVRLWRGSRQGLHPMHASGLPASLDAALLPDDTDTSRLGEVQTKETILRYCREVDRALHTALRDEQAPLVLAAVEYLHPIWREASTHPHLVPGGIVGSPDGLAAHDLHEQAWRLVAPEFQRSRAEAVERYRGMANSPRTSHDIKGIVQAASHGRVETLFAAHGHQRWGTLDTETGQVELHLDQQPGDMDLLDAAAVQTLLHGGTVYAVDFPEMPEQVLLAATYRY
jgi:release factor family 3